MLGIDLGELRERVSKLRIFSEFVEVAWGCWAKGCLR